MSTKEGDHGRATYYLRTGYLPQGPVHYPTLGSLVAKELEDESAELPSFVSIAPVPRVQPGGVRPGVPRPAVRPADRRRAGRRRRWPDARAAFVPGRRPRHARTAIGRARADARLELDGHRWAATSSPPAPASRPLSHQDAYQRAVRLMRSSAAKAFDLDEEPAAAARRLRPEPVRPGLPAGPPAGRAGRAVRRGHALVRRRLDGLRLGHAPAELRRRQEAQRRARPGLVDPDDR